MWTVSEAKAQLSEILRKARNGEPQVIGTQMPCIVVSKDTYDELLGHERHDGRWLLALGQRMGGVEFELPDRDGDREFSFEEH